MTELSVDSNVRMTRFYATATASRKELDLTQCENILEYMKTHNEGITPADAIENFHCFRLAARIADLKSRGYKITSTLIKEKRNGVTIQYSRYTLG